MSNRLYNITSASEAPFQVCAGFSNKVGSVLKLTSGNSPSIFHSEPKEKCPVTEACALSAGIQSSRIMDASVMRYAETL